MIDNMAPQPYPLWARWRTETDGSAMVERDTVVIEHHHARVIGWWPTGDPTSPSPVVWRGRAVVLSPGRALDVALYDTQYEAAAEADSKQRAGDTAPQRRAQEIPWP
jgi:hypothetical protein